MYNWRRQASHRKTYSAGFKTDITCQWGGEKMNIEQLVIDISFFIVHDLFPNRQIIFFSLKIKSIGINVTAK